MEKAKLERILEKISRFAGMEQNDLRMEKWLVDLVSSCRGVGLNIQSCEIDPLVAHKKVVYHLSELSEGRGEFKFQGQDIIIRAPMIIDCGESTYESDENGSLFKVNTQDIAMRRAPSFFLEPGGIDGLIFAMYFLMFNIDVKRVIKCPGCNRYFFRIKGRRLACSDTCRKRKSAANMTPEQIAITKKKRQERYRK
jgi:hypothetical protein